MPPCPVTRTEVSLLPGKPPKFTIAVPLAPILPRSPQDLHGIKVYTFRLAILRNINELIERHMHIARPRHHEGASVADVVIAVDAMRPRPHSVWIHHHHDLAVRAGLRVGLEGLPLAAHERIVASPERQFR